MTIGPRRVAILLAATLVFAVLVALGSWQVQRRAWKLALIERVEQRVHQGPVAVPGPSQWPTITVANDEYRRVRASGQYLAAPSTLVQAVTELGAGFWVLTPLQLADGGTLLINRGFVASEHADRVAPPPPGPVAVTGLLRLSEPGGGFLRHNDAAANRWYSRDVQAIAAARGLSQVAPFFIDAEADAGPTSADGVPIGGLTVIRFSNSHAVYALTWYTLALMVAAGAWRIARTAGGGGGAQD